MKNEIILKMLLIKLDQNYFAYEDLIIYCVGDLALSYSGWHIMLHPASKSA